MTRFNDRNTPRLEGGASLSGLDNIDPCDSQWTDCIKKDAEQALKFLDSTSAQAAVLMVTDWQPAGTDHCFENLELLEEVIAETDCYIVTISRSKVGGTEQFLFIARNKRLSDEEYLVCVSS